MDKLSGNKHAFLLGDFNIDLMKNDIDEHTATFLDTLTPNLFVPHIIHPRENLNSIRMREKLYKKFVKAKDKDVKKITITSTSRSETKS